jgi:FlaA1/EpsC-like NDP-sugar epimerase
MQRSHRACAQHRAGGPARREPVELDEPGIAALLSGKTVLVTGAGGSIGSELCMQVRATVPIASSSTSSANSRSTRSKQRLEELHPRLPLVRLIGDVKDLAAPAGYVRGTRPDVIFHAAAFKHVPLMEEANAWRCLQNNILGTWNAATAAGETGAQRFVLISTDKAVNPTNVMGASKRAAEMVLSQMATRGCRPMFSAVRFGNVLGSSGSVIPKFKEQIAKGGPVTVTHADITRYFMTIPEAARLVLQAAALAETGQVYVLDMGEPVKIVELRARPDPAERTPREEIGIVFSGLRPGEKLYEELLADCGPRPCHRSHPRLRIAALREPTSDDWLRRLLGWLS